MSGTLSQLNLELVEASQVRDGAAEFALVRDGKGHRLAVAATGDGAGLAAFEGDASSGVLVGPLSPKNAAALRARFEWLRPRPLGTKTSAGLGDRLGLATPGHVRAVRAVGGTIAPIFPQQSIREMARTQRTPIEVMDDATWGMFAEGWQGGTGADADHLKTTDDIDATLPVGFSMFTI
ncbi:MAG TPA: tagaturonate epimerase family protein, partial [Vicinamibacteria bacterium]